MFINLMLILYLFKEMFYIAKCRDNLFYEYELLLLFYKILKHWIKAKANARQIDGYITIIVLNVANEQRGLSNL